MATAGPSTTHSCVASRKAPVFNGKSGSFTSRPRWQNRTQDREGPELTSLLEVANNILESRDFGLVIKTVTNI